MAQTNTVRVTETVHNQVHAASRLLGESVSDLLAKAWEQFAQSPAFARDFEEAQKAFSVGDLDHVAEKVFAIGAGRARARADAVKSLRNA